MAKLFKLSAYLIDENDAFDEQDLEDYFIWRLSEEFSADHVHLESADIPDWTEDHPLNNINCPEEEYEKYFTTEKHIEHSNHT